MSASAPSHPSEAGGGRGREVIAWARREPVLCLLTVVLAALSVLPLWVGRYVPLLDYPFHVSQIFIWRHLDDPAWSFGPYYETNLQPLPYWLEYALTFALSHVMSTESAVKLFVSASLLALPAAVAVYARHLGRDPRLALLMLPLGWNFNMQFGFLAYVGGLPLLFLSLWALDRNALAPSPRRALIAAMLGLLLYFAHILILVVAAILAGLVLPFSVRPASLRRALWAGLPLVPAFAVAGGAYLAAPAIGSSVAPYSQHSGRTLAAAFNTPKDSLLGIGRSLIDILPCQLDVQVLAALAAVVLVLLFARPRGQAKAAATGRDLFKLRVEAMALLSGVLYFLLPRSLLKPFYWWGVSARLGVVAAGLLILCVRGQLTGLRRSLLVVAGGLSALFLGDISLHFYRFNLRTRDFDAILREVPPGKRVLPLIILRGDPDVSVNAYNHFGAYVQLHQGGYLPEHPGLDFPVRVRRHLPAPSWDSAEAFRFSLHGAAWDYFLVRDAGDHNLFSGYESRALLRRQIGSWRLYERAYSADM